MIRAGELVQKFQYALNDKWGYIWGKVHDKWTAEKQNAYEKAYSGDPDRGNSAKYGKKWIGHWVTDCSGLFVWAFKEYGLNMYHGSNTMYLKWCTSKGQLKSGKRTDGKTLKPGTAVFVWNSKKQNYSHVGLYVGNGTVIEAMGAQNGVTTTKVSNSKWTNWGELQGVIYDDSPEPEPPEPTPPAGKAIVTGKNVALRYGPSTATAVQIRIATGTEVDISKVEGWTYVRYGSYVGFMMNEFISVDGDTVTVTGKNVALREGMSTSSRVKTRIPTGKTARKESLPTDWACIEYGGKKGFMMKQFIKEG